jgi:hypothetical protein
MHKTLMKLSDEQFVDEINKAFVRHANDKLKRYLLSILFRHLMFINNVEFVSITEKFDHIGKK